MRGDLIRILSSIEEKANELKFEGYNADLVLIGREAYDFLLEQVKEEFGGEEDIVELSGLRVRVVDEFGGDAIVVDSQALGFGNGGAKRVKVILQ